MLDHNIKKGALYKLKSSEFSQSETGEQKFMFSSRSKVYVFNICDVMFGIVVYEKIFNHVILMNKIV